MKIIYYYKLEVCIEMHFSFSYVITKHCVGKETLSADAIDNNKRN